MSKAVVKCRHCGAEFTVPASLAGQLKLCSCGQILEIPSPSAEEEAWYYSKAGQSMGPISLQDLKEMAARGEITPEQMVYSSTLGEWRQASSVEKLREVYLPPSPAMGHWYVAVGGKSYGPYSFERMLEMMENGQVNLESTAWSETLHDWTPLKQVEAFASAARTKAGPVPEAAAETEQEVEEVWYYLRGGERVGPLTLDQMVQAVAQGRVGPEDRVWSNLTRVWRDAVEVPELSLALQKATERMQGELWYYRSGGKTEGPVSLEELTRLVEEKKVWIGDAVFSKTLGAWRDIRAVPQLEGAIGAAEAGLGQADRKAPSWFFRSEGQERGPVTEHFLAELVVSGSLKAEDSVWGPRSGQWRRVLDVPELARYLNSGALEAVEPAQASHQPEEDTHEVEPPVAVGRDFSRPRRKTIILVILAAALIIALVAVFSLLKRPF